MLPEYARMHITPQIDNWKTILPKSHAPNAINGKKNIKIKPQINNYKWGVSENKSHGNLLKANKEYINKSQITKKKTPYDTYRDFQPLS